MPQTVERILALHHNDLDGLSSGLCVVKAHPQAHVEHRDCHYGNVNQLLLTALVETKRPYKRIVLSDISMNVPGDKPEKHPDQELIDYTLPEAIQAYVDAGGELVVLDHHPGALKAKAYYGRWLHADSILEKVDATGVARAGSEQGARYYVNLREFRDDPGLVRAIKSFGRVCGAYDVWRKDEDFKLGAQMAMGLSLMWDNDTAFRDMLTMVERSGKQADPGPIDWSQHWHGTSLGAYIEFAPTAFETEVARALKTSIRHGDFITEIHSEFFESLVAEAIYERTGFITCMRYHETRHKAKKLSFRSHHSFGLDLGRVLGPIGGGGHAHAAGINHDEGYIDDVIAHVAHAAEMYATPEAA